MWKHAHAHIVKGVDLQPRQLISCFRILYITYECEARAARQKIYRKVVLNSSFLNDSRTEFLVDDSSQIQML